MGDYHLRWTLDGKNWKAILDYIQPTVEDLAKRWNAVLARERGDAPGVDVRWYTPDDVGRAVQIGIEGTNGVYELNISGSVWKDFDQPPKPRERKWRFERFPKMPVPRDLKVDLGRLKDSLQSSYSQVCRWTEKDLSQVDPLPFRDPNLTGRIVGGQYVP